MDFKKYIFFFLMDLRAKCLVKDFLFGFVCLLSLDVGDRGWWVPNGVGGTCLVTQGESCDLAEFLVRPMPIGVGSAGVGGGKEKKECFTLKDTEATLSRFQVLNSGHPIETK